MKPAVFKRFGMFGGPFMLLRGRIFVLMFSLFFVCVKPVQAVCGEELEAFFEPVERYPEGELRWSTIPDYPCYRTIAEINQQLNEWEDTYPNLANVITIGYSYESRPLQVLRLTNRLTFDGAGFSGEKPVFFVMANIHGDEIITNEVAMVFIQYLLEHYGVDPDVTWLLDEHDIYVMVSANPDGHIRNEAGEPWANWRKNANPSYDDCDGNYYGVDLNRNFSFKWGGENSDGDPCERFYRGPYAVSEYETQAIQTFMHELFPDQRGPEVSDAAPYDATGIFASLHSYGNIMLWPWGYTGVATPNGSQLSTLGRKLASFTGYRARQAYYLYPTNGTTADWAYGELGIAAYTFEIGSYEDARYPPCSRYDALVQPNVQALLYAAKVARTPYLTSFGPDVLHVTSTPTWTLQGRYIEISTTIASTDGKRSTARSMLNLQAIAGAEVYLDVPPWRGGTPYPLEAVDGVFDEVEESVCGQLPLSIEGVVTSDKHLVFVRGRDAGGDWGPISADFVTVSFSTLMPAVATKYGVPGVQVPYTLTLTNKDQITHTFFFTYSTSHWPVTIVPTRVKDLSPASYMPVVVMVAIPEFASSSDAFPSNVVTVTVASEDDPAIEPVSSILTTELFVKHSIFLPYVTREKDANRSLSIVHIPPYPEDDKKYYQN